MSHPQHRAVERLPFRPVPRFDLFSSLTDAEEASLLSLAHRRRYTRGEPVFHEGDPGDTVHLIDKGHVAVRITTPAGDVATMRILGPGMLFALTDALYVPVAKRLARHLLQLHQQFAGGAIPLTRDDLAGLCGATRQSVNAVLSELQAEQALTIGRGRVTVTDEERLVRFSR